MFAGLLQSNKPEDRGAQAGSSVQEGMNRMFACKPTCRRRTKERTATKLRQPAAVSRQDPDAMR